MQFMKLLAILLDFSLSQRAPFLTMQQQLKISLPYVLDGVVDHLLQFPFESGFQLSER